MPESYLHVRCARNAYRKSGLHHFDIPSIVAGAAGPDILFYYLGLPNLARLGMRLHTQRCGPFLAALTRGAHGVVLRSYVLGFLSHNATDATLHPWIAAAQGAHAELEQKMDSLYLLRDKGRGIAVPGDSAARLWWEKALEIGGLFSHCIYEVYGRRVNPTVLAKAFGDFYRCKCWFLDPCGRKKRVVAGAERFLGLESGVLSGHFITGRRLDAAEELDQLVERAEDLGAELMGAARAWWDGEIGPLELACRVGNRNYLTGGPA